MKFKQLTYQQRCVIQEKIKEKKVISKSLI